MAFTKGKSGNPGGRRKEKPFLDALRMEINAAGDDHKALRKIAAQMLKRAMAGDLAAATFIADRLDGKPVQAVANDGDDPFEVAVTRIERVIIDDVAGSALEPEADEGGGEAANGLED